MSVQSIINGGSLRLVRDSSIVRGDNGSLTFSVSLEIRDVNGFTEALSNYKVGNLFVMQDSQFIRMASWDDLMSVPVDHPEQVGGEYRSLRVTRQFSDVAQAVAWIKAAHDSILGLITNLKDYLAVFDAVKHEEAVIPTDDTQELYNRILEYQAANTELESVSSELAVARAKLEVLNAVYDNTLVDDPSSAQNIGAASVLKSALPRVQQLLNAVSDKLQDAVGINQGDQKLPSSISRIDNECASYIAALTAKVVQVRTLVTQTVGDPPAFVVPDPPRADIENILNSIDTDCIAELAASLDAIRSYIQGFISEMTVSDRGIRLMANIMTVTGVTSTDAINAVERMNVVEGVKTQELQTLRRRLSNDITALEEREEALIQSRQAYLDVLTSTYPDVDPNDPMKVFNYRVFRAYNAE